MATMIDIKLAAAFQDEIERDGIQAAMDARTMNQLLAIQEALGEALDAGFDDAREAFDATTVELTQRIQADAEASATVPVKASWWDRDLDWADPDFDPYRHDPVVQVALVATAIAIPVLTILLALIF